LLYVKLRGTSASGDWAHFWSPPEIARPHFLIKADRLPRRSMRKFAPHVTGLQSGTVCIYNPEFAQGYPRQASFKVRLEMIQNKRGLLGAYF
jgi:hypothetical protein